MIVFISAAATERLMVATASKNLPGDFPPVRVLDSGQLQTEAELDGLLINTGAEVRLFVVRVLGGKNYFERGFARLQEFCQKHQCRLLALPGDQNPDAELDAISNIPLADAATAFQYVLAGGVENYKNLLLYLADVFLSTAFGFEPATRMPDAGLYHPDATDYLNCANLSLAEFSRQYWREDRRAIGLLFYRAYWQSGDLTVIDGAGVQCAACLLLQPARRSGKGNHIQHLHSLFRERCRAGGRLHNQLIQLRGCRTVARRTDDYCLRSDG